MPRVSHLIRRNGIYWFKADLPDVLAGQRLPSNFPDVLRQLESPNRRGQFKTAVWLSLRTKAEREAKQRLGSYMAHHASLFDAAIHFLETGQLSDSCKPVAVERSVQLSQSLGKIGIEEKWTISQALQAWSAGGGAKGARRPAPNTITEADTGVRRFVELFGELPVRQINKAHGREYRDAISKIPKKLPAELKRLPLKELLEHDLAGFELRSATTINKSLTLLGAVLGRAEHDGYFDGVDWRNPFDVAIEVDPSDEDYYEPFGTDELRSLLASPVFADNERPKRGRGDTAKWVPLLALFQGARRTELIQLLVSDVARDVETGVWAVRFDREGDKKIKTLSSIRRVPVHPHLISLGFIEFVERRRLIVGPHGSLWPGFEDRTKLSSRANKWSEWFNGYITAHVVDDPAKKFHSFRGTFKRFARAAGVEEVVMNHLVGHANSSVSARYGRKRNSDGTRDSGYPLPTLLEEIAKIVFDEMYVR